ncbi:MAG: aspartate-semialdehyde dehydrogenase [Candidatus Bruticola sp.]
MTSKKYNFAVVGATGLVGSMMLKVLAERINIPINMVKAAATYRSAGTYVPFREQKIMVEDIASFDFSGIDIALFAGGDIASADYVHRAVAAGAVVIDNSSTFRMDPQVPLVVPEVNGQALSEHKGIIANPNCSTIQMMSVLAPLHRAFGLQSVSVATYQSVSGAGKEAVEELRCQTGAILSDVDTVESKVFPKRIGFNLFPQIGSFDASGNTTEEVKMVNETRKILELPNLPVLATCVRVPVFFAHSEAVQASFVRECSPEEAIALLSQAPCVKVMDDPGCELYPTPADGENQDEVLVGRIRRDPTSAHGLAMWIVADNLRKGAAVNAVNIAQALIERGDAL